MSTLVVGRSWDGALLAEDMRTELRLSWEGDWLRIDVRAPFAGDPAPASPVGSTDGLWEHEVVELFVVGEGDHYTEIELSPHGHHLVLQLEGTRNVVASGLPITFDPAIEGARWQGTARLVRTLLPARPLTCNAYRIHGPANAREHHALVAVPGPTPDFHRLDRFTPWPL